MQTSEIKKDRFPLGVQSFEYLRNSGAVYVDKTDYVYQLVGSKTKSYFLARPRRFGKSLFCSTLRAYFEGKRELFESLKIMQWEKDCVKHPVLYLDFVDGDYAAGPMVLINKIRFALKEYEDSNGIFFDESAVKGDDKDDLITKERKKLAFRFSSDLKAVYEKTNIGTVILVDEYDNPLIQSVDIETDKNTYRGFFSVLKSADEYIRFAFLTGVTKYAKTSIFSGANQPEDISFDESFSAVCGITHEELISYFSADIEEFAQKKQTSSDDIIAKLKKWYDCYIFHENGIKVFNPVSLFTALKKKEMRNYWYETGTPTVLMKRLKNSYFDVKTLKHDVEYSKDELTCYKDSESNPDIEPLLYYTGYLTIKSYDEESDIYTLGLPNMEVERSFFNSLAREFYGPTSSPTGFSYARFLADFRKRDTESVIERLKALFCSLPYANDKNAKLIERDFQNVIYLVFSILGEYIISEPHFSKGRADSILINNDYVYIFEFKIDQDAQTALQQINVKNYAGRFKMDGKRIIKVGVSFSSSEKNIVDWTEEEE